MVIEARSKSRLEIFFSFFNFDLNLLLLIETQMIQVIYTFPELFNGIWHAYVPQYMAYLQDSKPPPSKSLIEWWAELGCMINID